MASLPLDRHDWHGDWNYTLRPEPPAALPPPRPSRPPVPPGWAHPALTGMTATSWNQLISTLAIPHQIQHDIGLHLRRGGPATRKPSGGHPAALTLTEQALITVLRLRFRPLQAVARRTLRRRHPAPSSKQNSRSGPCCTNAATPSNQPAHASEPWPTSPHTPRSTDSHSPRNPNQHVDKRQALSALCSTKNLSRNKVVVLVLNL